MKKIAVVTFGLLLAAGPAFADAGVDQWSTNNNVGTASDGSNVWSNNGGVSNSDISNSAGIINENINVGAASNVASATDVAISVGGTGLSNAYLAQVSSGNEVGSGVNQSNSVAQTSGVANVGINGTQGVVSQQINTGLASNVGNSIGLTVR